MKTAFDVMTTPVVHTTPETSVASAARMLLQYRVSGLPVLDATGALVGVLTEGDLLRRVEIGTVPTHSRWFQFLSSSGKQAQEYVRTHTQRVSDIMTTNVLSIAPNTTLDKVVALMEQRRVKRLPVVENGRVIGIVSRANLVAALAEVIAVANLADAVLRKDSAAVSDAEIERSVWAAIRAEPWAPRGTIVVSARSGTVELSGIIFDERQREALRVVVENVPGVQSVTDRMSWVEPTTGTVIAPAP